jgi:hypothetical protein
MLDSNNESEGTRRIGHAATRMNVIGYALWGIWSLFFSFGEAHFFIEARTSRAWSTVRTREIAGGKIIGIKPSGVFMKPCVIGCIEQIALKDESVSAAFSYGVVDGESLRMYEGSVFAKIVIGEDDAALSRLALDEADPQEAIRSLARSALKTCAEKILVGVAWTPGLKTDIHLGCSSNSPLFMLKEIVASHGP